MTIHNLIASLSSHGFYVWDDFLTDKETQAIKEAIPDALQDARIGNRASLQGNKSVRGDLTLWLDPEMGDPIADYMEKMEALRQLFNAKCYLGLREFETHFCRYPSGAFYKKHIDNARDRNRRKITTVLYLNDTWVKGDGGELIIYDGDDQALMSIEPINGRMVFFMSEEFPHEVLPTHTTRESIAGWFLTQKEV